VLIYHVFGEVIYTTQQHTKEKLHIKTEGHGTI